MFCFSVFEKSVFNGRNPGLEWMERHNIEKVNNSKTYQISPCCEIREPCYNLTHSLSYPSNTSKQASAYHRTLRTTVLEAAGSFFVETVVGSWGAAHFLHDHLGFHILLCSGIYCDMGPLKQSKNQVPLHTQANTSGCYLGFCLHHPVACLHALSAGMIWHWPNSIGCCIIPTIACTMLYATFFSFC